MKRRLFSVFYMFVLTLCFTSVVSAVKVLNDSRIETNQKSKLEGNILRVLDILPAEEFGDRQLLDLFQKRVKVFELDGKKLYAGYEEDGKTLRGYAFPVSGAGFWGPVYGMAAVNPDGSELLGISFYKHSETPGLGGRISEKAFSGQFAGLSLDPLEGDENLFYLTPPGTGKRPNQLDAITGATGTSRAVETFLNRELKHLLDTIRPHINKG